MQPDLSRPCSCRLCVPSGEELEAHRQTVVDHVGEYGWHAAGVLADDQSPGWAYTVGLWHSLGRPEVSVFGLPVEKAMDIVNVAGRLVRDGGTLVDGRDSDEILRGVPVAVRKVHFSWYADLFGQAVGFYQGKVPPMLQLVWPDRSGRWPWEAEVEASCRDSQPMLWLPWDDHPRNAWTALRDGQ
ncbi:DUF4262 domain-containing protein [Catellatospora sp. KI3]|uniref:DUF4262 domain-containing protein n=1 Tax=Catellatospora sp. KI3 TaxID=3041620 RepID=UPI00248213BE|nr:DUF4262 domain-containing protein [Catellatospora sp. KI3]MDI1462970.1 DUF4262 domain-containing protein [Catellatospora sp. KI3]